MASLVDTDSANIRGHYDNHLGNFYDWSIGDFDAASGDMVEYFGGKYIVPNSADRIAIDLGCGSGIHAIPLARAGFRVKAIDFNAQLLEQLKTRKGDLAIEAISGDMLSVNSLAAANSAELIVCMGDTIAHLEAFSQLEQLFTAVYSTLQSNGKFIISYRDYGFELKGTSRFIPVKSDERRIHTCFLEYSSEFVTVTDQLYEREQPTGPWAHRISSYRKLRLTQAIVEKLLEKVGFRALDTEVRRRMIYTVCQK